MEGIREQLYASLGFGKPDSGDSGRTGKEEEIFPGETDHGLILDVEESPSDEIPTRVKTPRVTRPDRPKAKPRSSRALELRIAAIKDGIEEQLNDAGVVAGEQFGFHTAGMVVVTGSQAFSDSLVEMARNRPRLLAVLEKTGRGAGISKLLKYVLAIYLAVLVDLETRDPFSFPMQYLGVSAAYEKTHPQGSETPVSQPVMFAPPPGFQ